jgi:hypothetical protein
MKTGKLFAILVLLFALAIPMFGSGDSGGPKSWFHRNHSGPASSHYRGDHIVVKHHAGKHPKPNHARNVHP